MRRPWRIAGVLAAVVTLLAAAAPQAQACSCARMSRDQLIAALPVVFEGEILRIEMDAENRTQITTFRVRDAIKGVPRRMVLSVENVFKRTPQRTLTVVSKLDEAACGWDFHNGPARVYVGARREGSVLVTGYCAIRILNGRNWLPPDTGKAGSPG
jgi:hypothetical protein